MAKDKKTHPLKPFRVEVDYERYAHMLDDPALSESEKLELLQTLWNIIIEFASLGFGVHPLQQACEQVAESPDKPPLSGKSPVYLDHTLISEDFLTAAKGGTP